MCPFNDGSIGKLIETQLSEAHACQVSKTDLRGFTFSDICIGASIAMFMGDEHHDMFGVLFLLDITEMSADLYAGY